MNVMRLCITTLLLIATMAVAAPLRAEEADADHSQYVEAGREALGTRLPWYDAEKDDVRALDMPVPKSGGEFQNRQSRWQSSPATPSGGSGGTMPTMPRVGSITDILWTILKVIFWIVVGLVLLLLVYLLVRAYLQREDQAVATTSRTAQLDEDESDIERIESLPFTVARPRGDLLDEAMAQYKSGNFRQAVIYLYSYLLIQLDRHQQIRLARGKTNRMYLRELRQQPVLRSVLETTMLSFEDVFFGNHALTREEFERCLGRLDEFHQNVEQVGA